MLGAILRGRQLEVPLNIAVTTNLSLVACLLTRNGRALAVIDPFLLLSDMFPGMIVKPLKPAVELRPRIVYPPDHALSIVAREFAETIKEIVTHSHFTTLGARLIENPVRAALRLRCADEDLRTLPSSETGGRKGGEIQRPSDRKMGSSPTARRVALILLAWRPVRRRQYAVLFADFLRHYPASCRKSSHISQSSLQIVGWSGITFPTKRQRGLVLKPTLEWKPC